MKNEKLVAALKAEIENLNESYRISIDQMIRSLTDAKSRSVSSHLGTNLGSNASDLQAIASKIDQTKRVLETIAYFEKNEK